MGGRVGVAPRVFLKKLVGDVLDRIGDQWSLLVLAALEPEVKRFSQLEREIGDISKQMLSKTLRRLEQDGFVPDAKVTMIVEGETPTTMAKSTGLGLLELVEVEGSCAVLEGGVEVLVHLDGLVEVEECEDERKDWQDRCADDDAVAHTDSRCDPRTEKRAENKPYDPSTEDDANQFGREQKFTACVGNHHATIGYAPEEIHRECSEGIPTQVWMPKHPAESV